MAVIYQIIEGRDTSVILVPFRRGQVMVYTPSRGTLTPGRILEGLHELAIHYRNPNTSRFEASLTPPLGEDIQVQLKALYIPDHRVNALVTSYDEVRSMEKDGMIGLLRSNLNTEAQMTLEKSVEAEGLAAKADKLLEEADLSSMVLR